MHAKSVASMPAYVHRVGKVCFGGLMNRRLTPVIVRDQQISISAQGVCYKQIMRFVSGDWVKTLGLPDANDCQVKQRREREE